MKNIQAIIEEAWEGRDKITLKTKGPVRKAVATVLEMLDSGEARVAGKVAGANDAQWVTNQWLKKAVLLSFRLNDMALTGGGPGKSKWWDKVPSKFEGWTAKDFRAGGFRAVPNCIVRHSAYIAPGVILMPSFVNLGAYVDKGTMVDTWVPLAPRSARMLSLGGGHHGVPNRCGRPHHHRRQFSEARRSAKFGSWAKARSFPWACSSASPPRSSTGPPAKFSWAACRPIPLSYPARYRKNPLPMVPPVPPSTAPLL
jgi:hypothetical protein